MAQPPVPVDKEGGVGERGGDGGVPGAQGAGQPLGQNSQVPAGTH